MNFGWFNFMISMYLADQK